MGAREDLVDALVVERFAVYRPTRPDPARVSGPDPLVAEHRWTLLRALKDAETTVAPERLPAPLTAVS